MREITFTYNGAAVTVRRAAVRDRLAVDMLQYQLGAATNPVESYEQRTYLRFLTQTVKVDGDLGFELPKRDADNDALKAGLEAFLDMDASLYDEWIEALEQVSASVNDPDLAPGEKKEAPTS